jgi:hypothetical protein
LILYVNGDSHSAGAEAVNKFGFAHDDPRYTSLGRKPHPDNLRASYGSLIADNLGATLYCDAESASSNSRIMRTTNEYLKTNRPDLIIIGWATWEREEFIFDDQCYQFTAGMIVDKCWPPIPKHVQEAYKVWVVDADPSKKAQYWHTEIYKLHQQLNLQQIPHLFFNTLHDFNHDFIQRVDWGNSYVGPYDPKLTYWYWLQACGFKSNKWYHFGADAHEAWANHLTKIINESIITK